MKLVGGYRDANRKKRGWGPRLWVAPEASAARTPRWCSQDILPGKTSPEEAQPSYPLIRTLVSEGESDVS